MNRSKTTLGVIHVTATMPGFGLTMKKLEQMHKQRGFSTVGYNGVIFVDGRFEVSPRGLDGIGAHVAGFNSISLGISLEGGLNAAGKADEKSITWQQWDRLPQVMKEMTARYPRIAWCGHRDLSPDKNGDGIIEPYEWLKECPTFDVIPWAKSIGFKTPAIRGTWKEGPVLVGAPQIVFKGPDSRIAYLQKLLTKANFDIGPVDGIFGDKTQKAVVAFQRANGLEVTGEFNHATVKLLRSRFE